MKKVVLCIAQLQNKHNYLRERFPPLAPVDGSEVGILVGGGWWSSDLSSTFSFAPSLNPAKIIKKQKW